MAGTGWQERDFVFTSSTGTPFTQSRPYREYKDVLTKAGLADRRVHDLRGSAATLMLMEGIDLFTISKQLGHANIATTAAAYAHVLPALQRDAASKMNALLTGTK